MEYGDHVEDSEVCWGGLAEHLPKGKDRRTGGQHRFLKSPGGAARRYQRTLTILGANVLGTIRRWPGSMRRQSSPVSFSEHTNTAFSPRRALLCRSAPTSFDSKRSNC